MIRGPRRLFWRPFAPLLGLALVACGFKGPPVAPELRIPRAPAELRGSVEAQQITLEWSNPSRRQDGTPMIDLAKVRLHRLEDAGEGPPRPAMLVGSRVNGYTEVASFDVDRRARGGRYVDTQVAIGQRYTYVVTATDSQGRTSAPSARLSIAMIAAPRPPGGLAAREGEAEASLSWQPPAETIDGSPVTGAITYEVLRSSSPDVAPSEVRAGALQEPRFTDTKLENEQTYFYAVRATRTEPTGAATSVLTEPVAVTPRDMTPPAAPRDLVAVPSPGAVRLSWRASPEPDVAAVLIHRADGDGTPVRVGRADAPRTTFTDPVPPGTYRYFVTAIDRASRANESGRSNEVTVTVP